LIDSRVVLVCLFIFAKDEELEIVTTLGSAFMIKLSSYLLRLSDSVQALFLWFFFEVGFFLNSF